MFKVSSTKVSRRRGSSPLRSVTVALTTAVRIWWGRERGLDKSDLGTATRKSGGGTVLDVYALPVGPAASLGDCQLRSGVTRQGVVLTDLQSLLDCQ